MFDPSTSSSEFVVQTEIGAVGDVEALEMGATVEDGVKPFVCQAVACHLKKPELMQALRDGKGILIFPRLPIFERFLLRFLVFVFLIGTELLVACLLLHLTLDLIIIIPLLDVES